MMPKPTIADKLVMPFDELLAGIETVATAGSCGKSSVVTAVTSDSRKVLHGSLFVAVRGYCADGHRFIRSAADRGAVVVICEEFPDDMHSSCFYIQVADARKALAEVSRIFYRNAAERLQIIGVTGTNGKTTTAKLITTMLNANGIAAGYIGTNLCMIGDEHIPLDRTTPEAHELHALFYRMVLAGCRVVVMEVSSHALVLQRVHGIGFQAVVFTNLTPEHLDFHLSMQEYALAKQQLFGQLRTDGCAVVNEDDAFAALMAKPVAPEQRYGCSLSSPQPILPCRGHFRAEILESTLSSTTLSLHFPDTIIAMRAGLPGAFNVMNVLEAAAVGFGMGLSSQKICDSLSAISAVDGRMERVSDGSQGYSVFVDYAHTPDALLKVLTTLRTLKQENSRLIVLFGCGGNRDQSKRAVMGRIASEQADEVILTSDNPRYEEPELILDEIESGISRGNYTRVSDRSAAIGLAVTKLERGDVLLVAGKGHEQYQEIAGRKYPFSDRELLKQYIQNHGTGYPEKECVCE